MTRVSLCACVLFLLQALKPSFCSQGTYVLSRLVDEDESIVLAEHGLQNPPSIPLFQQSTVCFDLLFAQ